MTRFKLFLVILCLLLPLPSWAGDVIGEVIGMSGEVPSVMTRRNALRRALACR